MTGRTMRVRKLGPFDVNPVGLGCMNLSHAYGHPLSRKDGLSVLQKALDSGVTHFDSAALYGFGHSEELVGPFLKPHRDNVVLVSKCGMRGENGARSIGGTPDALRRDLEASLRRLDADVIDLYYLHRYDKVTPIEDSVGQLSRFVDEGKVRAIGLSEVSADTLRRAHAVHPIAAVQSEYSLWSRNPEIAVLDACEELGAGFVAFSPLARGFLTDVDVHPGEFIEKDIRRSMPRFHEPNFSKNTELLGKYRTIAKEASCTGAQLSLAWLLHQSPNLHVIPGTTSVDHLAENVGAAEITLDAATLEQVGELVNQETISGPRYPEQTQKEIDTEEFA